MEYEQMYFRARFIFSKSLPRFIEKAIKSEFLRLRSYAVREINSYLTEWNSEFTGPEPSKDDELAEYGGTAYCEYIREKMRTVLKQVNKDHRSRIINLDADEIGDIIAKTKIGNITMTLELEPVNIMKGS